jgi:hypothetical protein
MRSCRRITPLANPSNTNSGRTPRSSLCSAWGFCFAAEPRCRASYPSSSISIPPFNVLLHTPSHLDQTPPDLLKKGNHLVDVRIARQLELRIGGLCDGRSRRTRGRVVHGPKAVSSTSHSRSAGGQSRSRAPSVRRVPPCTPSRHRSGCTARSDRAAAACDAWSLVRNENRSSPN